MHAQRLHLLVFPTTCALRGRGLLSKTNDGGSMILQSIQDLDQKPLDLPGVVRERFRLTCPDLLVGELGNLDQIAEVLVKANLRNRAAWRFQGPFGCAQTNAVRVRFVRANRSSATTPSDVEFDV